MIPTGHFRQYLQTCENVNMLRNAESKIERNFEHILRWYQCVIGPTSVDLGSFEDGWSPWQTGRHKISPAQTNPVRN